MTSWFYDAHPRGKAPPYSGVEALNKFTKLIPADTHNFLKLSSFYTNDNY